MKTRGPLESWKHTSQEGKSGNQICDLTTTRFESVAGLEGGWTFDWLSRAIAGSLPPCRYPARLICGPRWFIIHLPFSSSSGVLLICGQGCFRYLYGYLF